jgi:hypothetical protein
MKRLSAWLILIVLSVAGMLAHGDPTVTIDASPKSGPSPLATTVSWTSTECATLTAGSTYGWNGVVTSASGSKKLSGILTNTTLSLTCDPVVAKSASIAWTYDWLYTDGTAVSNKAGFRVFYGTAADQLTQTLEVKDPSLRSADIELPAGTWYFQMLAFTSYGIESPRSNVISRTLATSQKVTVSVDLTVEKIMKAPVLQ